MGVLGDHTIRSKKITEVRLEGPEQYKAREVLYPFVSTSSTLFNTIGSYYSCRSHQRTGQIFEIVTHIVGYGYSGGAEWGEVLTISIPNVVPVPLFLQSVALFQDLIGWTTDQRMRDSEDPRRRIPKVSQGVDKLVPTLKKDAGGSSAESRQGRNQHRIDFF